jgi:NAD(P)-dependent dehydrogenase (short-subunit alcohol dehydrogenase family)
MAREGDGVSGMMRLDGRTVAVIGGGSGIGLGIAKAAASAGARVVLAGRSRERLEAAAREVGVAAEGRTLDAVDEGAVAAFFAGLGAGGLDHLVVTAAAGLPVGPFASRDPAAFRRGVDGKFWAFVHATRHALPALPADGGSSITLVTGAAARAAMPGTAGVAAVNGALQAMVPTLARELAPVRVNALSPGLVATPVYDAMPEGARDGMYRQAAERLPVRRIGTPDDLGQAALFLMTNGYTTGIVLDVDGGARLIG